MSGPIHRRWLILLLAVSFLGRAAWGLLQPATIDARLPDQLEYVKLGENLAGRGTLEFYDGRFGQHLLAYRTPGYPFFLAVLGAKPRLVRLAQAMLDTSTVLAAYLLARRWLAEGPAIMAGVLSAFNPFLVYFTGLVLSETLFTAMLLWGMVLLAYRPAYIWGGAMLALAVLVRPSAMLLPILLGYPAVFVTRVRGEIHRRSIFRLPVGATMILLVLAVLLPWGVRNRSALGEWIFFTTNAGITQYDGFNPDADGSSNQEFLESPQLRPVLRLSEVERDRYFSQAASEYIRRTWRENPMHLVRLTAAKIARTWSPIPLSAEFGSRWLYRAAGLAFSIPLDLLVVVGLWKGGLPRAAKTLLIAPALYFTVIHALSVGSLRYRVPVEPALGVLAAAGAAALLRMTGGQEFKRAE